MTQGVDNTAQLNFFTLIKDALLANSVISAKFNTTNIHEFEPKAKAGAFNGFPYILVNTEPTQTQILTFNNKTTEKQFGAMLFLRIEFLARDKFKDFVNAIIKAIESYESTFQSSGYLNVTIDFIDQDDNQVIHQKELVEGTFEITFRSLVER